MEKILNRIVKLLELIYVIVAKNSGLTMEEILEGLEKTKED